MTNSDSPRPFSVEYDPRLVEETVLLRIPGAAEEPSFRQLRDQIYVVTDSEERERRFREFHAEWFVRLQVGRPITESLLEQHALFRGTERCCVLPARTTQEEGADLHELRAASPVDREPDKVIVIRLKPACLLDPPRARAWLRHELMHVTDMLDPAFGYEPQLPSPDAGPAFTTLLQERYRVLWDCWIDGRLARRGWLPEQALEMRWEEFRKTFAAFGPEARQRFQELRDSESQTHAVLVALALHPVLETGPSRATQTGPQPCPLCRFPTFPLCSDETELSDEVRDQIREDFPKWKPEHGLCRQCADLYGAREMSRSAEAALPRI